MYTSNILCMCISVISNIKYWAMSYFNYSMQVRAASFMIRCVYHLQAISQLLVAITDIGGELAVTID